MASEHNQQDITPKDITPKDITPTLEELADALLKQEQSASPDQPAPTPNPARPAEEEAFTPPRGTRAPTPPPRLDPTLRLHPDMAYGYLCELGDINYTTIAATLALLSPYELYANYTFFVPEDVAWVNQATQRPLLLLEAVLALKNGNQQEQAAYVALAEQFFPLNLVPTFSTCPQGIAHLRQMSAYFGYLDKKEMLGICGLTDTQELQPAFCTFIQRLLSRADTMDIAVMIINRLVELRFEGTTNYQYLLDHQLLPLVAAQVYIERVLGSDHDLVATENRQLVVQTLGNAETYYKLCTTASGSSRVEEFYTAFKADMRENPAILAEAIDTGDPRYPHALDVLQKLQRELARPRVRAVSPLPIPGGREDDLRCSRPVSVVSYLSPLLSPHPIAWAAHGAAAMLSPAAPLPSFLGYSPPEDFGELPILFGPPSPADANSSAETSTGSAEPSPFAYVPSDPLVDRLREVVRPEPVRGAAVAKPTPQRSLALYNPLQKPAPKCVMPVKMRPSFAEHPAPPYQSPVGSLTWDSVGGSGSPTQTKLAYAHAEVMEELKKGLKKL